MSKQSIATGAGFDNHADSFYKGALYSGPFFFVCILGRRLYIHIDNTRTRSCPICCS